jgi:hypothetical protein
MKNFIDFKKIHLGKVIKDLVQELDISEEFIMQRIKCDKNMLQSYYKSENIDVKSMLKWSKILRFDLFRLYSMHLMLHHGISMKPKNKQIKKELGLRKNVYTHEMKIFIINQIRNNAITISGAIEKYSIPKTTIYKWLKQIAYDEKLPKI